MFCRFCGKEIPEDSGFCQYCGKSQSVSAPVNKQTVTQSTKAKSEGISLYTLSKISSIVFYIGIVVFLILFTKMAPGVGSTKFYAYIIGAVVTIVLAVLVHKIRDKKYTQSRQLLALFFGLLLLIPSIGLRIVYECKVDTAVADIPSSGMVYLDMTTDEEFFSYIGDGIVRDPSSNITIGDEWLEGSATFEVELNKKYDMRVGTGYTGNHNYTDTSITFTANKLKDGYSVVEKVSLGKMEYAEVTINFERVCSFWDVIFY